MMFVTESKLLYRVLNASNLVSNTYIRNVTN